MISSHIYRANSNFWILSAAGFLTVILVAIPTLNRVFNEASEYFLSTLGLIFFFSFLLATYWYLNKKWLIHLSIFAQIVTVTILIVINPTTNANFSTYFFIIAAQLLIFLPIWEGAFWAVLIALNTILGESLITGRPPGAISNSLAIIGAYTFFAVFGALFRSATANQLESEALTEELQSANQRLADYAAEVEKLAVVDERNRLARELHDALGHRLTVAVVQLEGARRLIPTEPDRAATMVDTMRSELKEGLAELRETVASLRTQPDEHLTLADAMTALIANYRDATGLNVHTEFPTDLPPISYAAHHALFRAGQESLTNVQRHAQATDVWVKLAQPETELVLSVADNGEGFPEHVADDRFGIQGIRERIELLGGWVQLGRSHRGGAMIEIAVPIRTGGIADG